MSTKDLSVIVYKILSYLRKCGENGEKVDINFLTSDVLDTNEKQLNLAIYEAYKNGFIEGVREVNTITALYKQMKILPSIYITLKGEEYLEENSIMNKVKNLLIDVAGIFT